MSITSTLFLGLCVGSLCIIAASGNPLIDSIRQAPVLVIPEGGDTFVPQNQGLVVPEGGDIFVPENQGLVVPEGEIPVLGQPPVSPVGPFLGSYPSCTSNLDCDGNSLCYFTYSGIGTCEPKGIPGSFGQPCLTLMDCSMGLYCEWLSDVDPYGHCAPLEVTSEQELSYLQPIQK